LCTLDAACDAFAMKRLYAALWLAGSIGALTGCPEKKPEAETPNSVAKPLGSAPAAPAPARPAPPSGGGW
jgi:hypothetical protein